MFVLRASVTVALVAYVCSEIDIAQLAHRLTGAKEVWVVATLLVLATQIVLAALRWQRVICTLHDRIGIRRSLRYTWEGAFFSQMLPSAIGGDVVRVWRIHKAGVPGQVAASSVLLDRVSALVSVIAAVFMILPVLISVVRIPHFGSGVIALVMVGLGGLVALLLMDRLVRLPATWAVTQLIHRLATDARKLLLRPASAVVVVGYSFLILGLSALALFLLGISLGIPLGLKESLVFTPLIILITTLPISMAGWGVREFGMAAMLGHVGIQATDAVALSVAFGLAIVAASLPGGVLWLVKPEPRTEGTRVQFDANSDLGGRP